MGNNVLGRTGAISKHWRAIPQEKQALSGLAQCSPCHLVSIFFMATSVLFFEAPDYYTNQHCSYKQPTVDYVTVVIVSNEQGWKYVRPRGQKLHQSITAGVPGVTPWTLLTESNSLSHRNHSTPLSPTKTFQKTPIHVYHTYCQYSGKHGPSLKHLILQSNIIQQTNL